MRALFVEQPQTALRAWPLVVKWVAEATLRGKSNLTPDDVRKALERGAMQLWLAWTGKQAKGVCVTEVYDTARGKTCGLVIIGGVDFSEWLPLIATIKLWARAQGCVRLEGAGRPGWERRVKGDGWQPIRTTLEMVL